MGARESEGGPFPSTLGQLGLLLLLLLSWVAVQGRRRREEKEGRKRGRRTDRQTDTGTDE
jgi:hypothetical protein